MSDEKNKPLPSVHIPLAYPMNTFHRQGPGGEVTSHPSHSSIRQEERKKKSKCGWQTNKSLCPSVFKKKLLIVACVWNTLSQN